MQTISKLGSSCLTTFSSLMPNAMVAFYRIDGTLMTHDYQVSGIEEAIHDEYVGHYYQYDPLHPKYCSTSKQQVIRLVDALNMHSGDNNLRFKKFMNKYDLVDMTEIILLKESRPFAGISLLRTSRFGEFKPHEISVINHLQSIMQSSLEYSDDVPEESRHKGKSISLTPRESQLVELLRQGNTNKTMARQLGISSSTIKGYLDNLYLKLNVSNRTELVAVTLSSRNTH